MSRRKSQAVSEDERREANRGVRRGPWSRGRIAKAEDPGSALKRLLSYLGPYRKHLALTGSLTVASTLLSLAAPYLIGVAIDQYIIPGNLQGLIRATTLLSIIYLLSSLTNIAANWIMATVSQRSLQRLRGELFHHIQTLSLSYFDRQPAGDLMSRLTNDVDAIGAALSQNVTQLIGNLLTLVGVVVAMFALNVGLTLASLIVFPLMVGLTAIVGKRTRSSFRDLQKSLGALNSVMQETITGQRVVIAFNQQKSANRKFGESNLEVKRLGVKATIYAMLIPPLMGILSNANIAIVAGLGSWMAIQGMATVGTISAFIGYSRQFANPLRHLANLYNSIQSALAGAERVFQVLDTEAEVEDHPEAVGIEDFEGEVVFQDVGFSYIPDVPVLRSVNLTAKPGQTIALVGPTGAGKTTIINVLTRFYDIQEGVITIDQKDIRMIKKDHLRRKLGLVLQDTFLFSGTIIENIRYGRLDASDLECIEAAKLANAHQFITRLPQQYQTVLTERGGNLSQGQQQLLCIARAIVADPSILVLDEATSSVDTRTEKQLQEALLNLMEGRTSFVIAHRLSTIQNADQVMVINKGEIIEVGTHRELLEKRGFYHNLYTSQFKGTDIKADHTKISQIDRENRLERN